jgi:RHH-type transcriptional regulator, proline utilization regulon repressor / proline dehydrogenase / delta 1-pyrroline-5-carboxylate dehydrogenase
MAGTTIGVKLDEQVRTRLKQAAALQGRTTHWLVKQLLLVGLERLERGEDPLARAAPAEPAPAPAATPVPFLDLAQDVQPQSVLRAAITAATRRPEPECLPALLAGAALPPPTARQVAATAENLVRALRARRSHGLVETLLQEYALSSQEGVALMCLAEALLRIPDSATRDALIRDKIGGADWQAHLAGSHSLFVHAATWGLLLTGRLTSTASETSLSSALAKLIARGGEPLIRRGLNIAMRLLGEQFVLGQTIGEALANSRRLEARGFRHSYDMLGEAALTEADAARYYRDYEQAIHAIGKAGRGRGVYAGPGISVKLSALHPRYARAQRRRVMAELLPRLAALVTLARRHDIGINIDAEEADRLELSLDLLEALCFAPALEGWNGIGFVVQAYQKRTPFVLDFLIDLARRSRHRLMLRLVKGAYWDSEIKRAQVDGLDGFPVFTRKLHTDVCYLACARKLLDAPEAIFPQFATHNAQTLAAVLAMAGKSFHPEQYEFQCLHGMGEALYDEVVGPKKLDRPCRIYAPVGTHATLLPYLVRRLLENGANTSFVNRIASRDVPLAALVADPVADARAISPVGAPHPRIAAPRALFAPARANSAGYDLANEQRLASFASAALASLGEVWQAAPILAGGEAAGPAREIVNPADRRDRVGVVIDATPDAVAAALAGATEATSIWQATPPEDRAAVLRRGADLLEARMPTLAALIVREAGKTLSAAIGEVREATDFLRYYGAEIVRDFDNHTHRPLGVVAAISPWNFPLAIFTGQVAGALAAGNVVLAKPAEETPLIAACAVRLLLEAGVPRGALQLVPGDGAVGAALVADPRVRGVVFTGSTAAARAIQRSLAGRLDPRGAPIPLIAETGGQNAMVVDSSALPEQAIADIIASGFDSAGQRCSALRILLVQEEVADRLVFMLKGAMRELSVGRPDRLASDIGPVIGGAPQAAILQHVEAMRARGYPVFSASLPPEAAGGHFVAPTLIEIPEPAVLAGEVFGPVIHLARYPAGGLEAMLDQVNALGYALTFGIHSRIDETIARASARIAAGNIYVNRTIIGAVVGVQPFGGHRLSGTGPKAGGPLYLRRLLVGRPAPSGLPCGAAPEPFRRFLAALDPAEAADVAGLEQASPLGVQFDLPGPVGEQNTYRLIPRGDVLCVAATRAGAIRQVAAALATGNRALVECQEDASFADRLPASLRPHITRARPDGADTPAVALFQGEALALLRLAQRLAGQDGAVVPIHAALDGAGAAACYPLEYLLAEQATSVNTAAAGGNATLMTIG